MGDEDEIFAVVGGTYEAGAVMAAARVRRGRHPSVGGGDLRAVGG